MHALINNYYFWCDDTEDVLHCTARIFGFVWRLIVIKYESNFIVYIILMHFHVNHMWNSNLSFVIKLMVFT